VLDASWQLQRVGKNLIHKRRTTTASSSDFTIPLPHACAAAPRQKPFSAIMASRNCDQSCHQK
jgi:hypothetical protein